MFRSSLKGHKKLCRLEDERTLGVVSYIGRLYKRQGRLNEAVDMIQLALRGYEKALSPCHTPTLMEASTLGHVYMSCKRCSSLRKNASKSKMPREKIDTSGNT